MELNNLPRLAFDDPCSPFNWMRGSKERLTVTSYNRLAKYILQHGGRPGITKLEDTIRLIHSYNAILSADPDSLVTQHPEYHTYASFTIIGPAAFLWEDDTPNAIRVRKFKLKDRLRRGNIKVSELIKYYKLLKITMPT